MKKAKLGVGWHLFLVWLISASAIYFFVYRPLENADSVLIGNSIAEAFGVSIIPLAAAWLASRIGRNNPRAWVWSVGTILTCLLIYASFAIQQAQRENFGYSSIENQE